MQVVHQGVILAAGRGTRLHPLTLTRTKAMAPVAGKPIVARVMETLIQNGIRDFILLISPDDQEIVPYFQEKFAADAKLQFIVQPQRLGMANALGLAAPYLNGSFIMSACDNLTPSEHVAELLTKFQTTQANATLSLMAIDIEQASSTGIIEWKNGLIQRIVEKPKPEEAPSNISSLPLYVFSPKLLTYLPEVKPSPRREYELQDAIQMLIERDGGVNGVLTPSRVQLTNMADLLALNQYYLEADQAAAQVLSQQIGEGVRLLPPVRIEADVVIGPGCIIGPRVYIEPGCTIGDNVHLTDAVVLRQIKIASDKQMTNAVVYENQCGD
ncbi:MAG: sugar phosphate nucleotidyltransferase [Caldilineaceae bacterium]